MKHQDEVTHMQNRAAFFEQKRISDTIVRQNRELREAHIRHVKDMKNEAKRKSYQMQIAAQLRMKERDNQLKRQRAYETKQLHKERERIKDLDEKLRIARKELKSRM